MFKVGILDDSTLEQQETRLLIQTWLTKKNLGYELFLYKSAEEVSDELDILFMEASKGEDSLLWLVKDLHKKNPLLPVIIVTNDEQQRKTAQEYHCYAYVKKGKTQRKFKALLEEVWTYLEALRRLQNKDRISFKTTRHYISVPREDVLYFKFKDRRVMAITKDREYTVQHTLKELSKIVGENFSFCHRSCLVNLEHVRLIFGVRVTLDNGEELVLSQKRGKLFRLDLKAYSQRMGRPIGKRKRVSNKEKTQGA